MPREPEIPRIFDEKTKLTKKASFIVGNVRWMAGGFLLTMLSTFGQTYFIGLSGNSLREHLSLSGAEFGIVFMIATLACAFTLFWLGRSLDAIPGWKVTRMTMPGLALSCILMAFVPHVLLLIVAIFLLRLLGAGLMVQIALTSTARWFTDKRGQAMSLVNIGAQCGAAVLPPAYVIISEASNWQMAWLCSAALLLVACPAVIALTKTERIPEPPSPGSKNIHTARDWTREQVLRDPILYLMLAGMLSSAFIVTVILFHQGHLIALRGYDPVAFAAAFPVMAGSTVVFGLVSGYLVDRFGAINLLPWYLVPLIIASAGVALIKPVWGIYLFMLLLGISNGVSSTLSAALWPEIYGLANIGSIRSMMVSTQIVATAIGPGITGLFIDRGINLPQQLLWMSGWCVLASVLLGIAARRLKSRR